LGISTWITALVFVEPLINASLTPFDFKPQIWIGLISIVAFFLTLLQIKLDWRGCADSYQRSLAMYGEIKQECRRLLSSGHNITMAECQHILTQYDTASKVCPPIPEKEFLKQKQRHRIKIAISRELDNRPGASILLMKIKFFFRDNFSVKEVARGGQSSKAD